MNKKVLVSLGILAVVVLAVAAYFYSQQLPAFKFLSFDRTNKKLNFSYDGKNYSYELNQPMIMLPTVRGYSLMIERRAPGSDFNDRVEFCIYKGKAQSTQHIEYVGPTALLTK